jgi:hypothetical protein
MQVQETHIIPFHVPEALLLRQKQGSLAAAHVPQPRAFGAMCTCVKVEGKAEGTSTWA